MASPNLPQHIQQQQQQLPLQQTEQQQEQLSLQQTNQQQVQDVATNEEHTVPSAKVHGELPLSATAGVFHRLVGQPSVESMSEGEDDAFYSSPQLYQLSSDALEVSMHELSFLALPSQSNVYGMSAISYQDTNMLLVATLRGEIYKLEYDQRSLRPSLKPVTFSYIPGAM